MKQIILMLLLLPVAISFKGYSQVNTDTNTFGFKLIEFRAGILCSRYYHDKDDQIMLNKYGSDTLENKFTTGFTLGIGIGIINKKHFSVKPELLYSYTHHQLKYHYQDSIQSSGYHFYQQGSYSISSSFVQLSVMMKYKFGKIVKAFVGGGPFLNFPVYTAKKGWEFRQSSFKPDKIFTNNQIIVNLNPGLGLFACSGISVPYKRSNFEIEFRVYFTALKPLINDLNINQRSFTVNLIYQLKRKNTFW